MHLLGGMYFKRCKKHSKPITTDTVSSNHIIQTQTLLKGDLEFLVWSVASQKVIPAFIIVRPHTAEATMMSAFVMFSFWYVGEMSGPHGLNEGSCRNSSFIAYDVVVSDPDCVLGSQKW